MFGLSKKTLGLIISILVVLCAAIGGYYYFLHKPVGPNDYSSLKVGEEINRNKKKKDKADYNADNIQPVNETEIALKQAEETLNPTSILAGGLLIPRIGLKLPIYEGIGGRHMWLGACTRFPDREPGKGNYVLLGHNTNDRSLVFSSLKEITKDMIGTTGIYVTDDKYVYTYVLSLIEIVPDTQTRWEKPIDESETPVITLITCYGGDGTTNRRIVRGVFQQKDPIDKSPIQLN